MIGRLQEFAGRVAEGLERADWATRREIIRALVKRIEVGVEAIRVVYRIGAVPFVEAPDGGISQDCWKRADPFVSPFVFSGIGYAFAPTKDGSLFFVIHSHASLGR